LINVDDANGEVINICSGKALELRQILDYMIKLTGLDISLQIDKDLLRTIDIEYHYGDNRKLISFLDEFEFIDWQTSVKKMMDKI